MPEYVPDGWWYPWNLWFLGAIVSVALLWFWMVNALVLVVVRVLAGLVVSWLDRWGEYRRLRPHEREAWRQELVLRARERRRRR